MTTPRSRSLVAFVVVLVTIAVTHGPKAHGARRGADAAAAIEALLDVPVAPNTHVPESWVDHYARRTPHVLRPPDDAPLEELAVYWGSQTIVAVAPIPSPQTR